MSTDRAGGAEPGTASQFVWRRRVAFAETDMAGIVHFANFHRYMEEAEHACFRTLGLSIVQPQDDGPVIGWPRVQSACTYEAPAYYDELLEIRIDLARVGMKSLTWRFEFHRGAVRIARGELKTVCCLCRAEASSGAAGPGWPSMRLESIEIPERYRAVLQPSPFIA